MGIWRCSEKKKDNRCGFILIADTDPVSSTKLVTKVKKKEARQKRANEMAEQNILNQLQDIKSRHKTVQAPQNKATKKACITAVKTSTKQWTLLFSLQVFSLFLTLWSKFCSFVFLLTDNIVFARTYIPYMYKVNKKLNIAFVLKTAFADQLERRHYPSLYDHLDVVLEKVVPVFGLAQDSNCLEFNEVKVRRRYALEPQLPLRLEEHYQKNYTRRNYN